ncbi:helix-turn-helix transcriptional regulator [Cohnella abietis]|uniref:Transcriptional regulator n=1 Tax=Cohnella abietis TaxID=2507935 RepID=A0A3T1D429_9BACL|nr:helix-turn-helix transcriptional regulator [Cohnella abietis]BBI32863.1 transcriptional regulator [Cohnella abietis]
MKQDEEGITIELTSRQQDILAIVTSQQPISGESIADQLHSTRPVIRADLALLVMLNYLEAKPKVGYSLGSASRKQEMALEKLLDMKVKEFQAAPVVLRETATVSDAVVALFLENVGSLIVSDEEGYLAGIVSRKDLLKVSLGNAAATAMPISLVMTRHPNVHTITPEESIVAAARKMISYQVDSLPVVKASDSLDDEGKRIEVVGRITKTTMTKILLEVALGL